MFTPREYDLIDFGDGRRLERFGPWLLDRPCPAAEQTERADPRAWQEADARFDRTDGEEGQWSARTGESITVTPTKGTVPFSSDENWDSPPVVSSPVLRRELPEPWTIAHGPVTFELKRTVFGHLGVFPEQAANWDWITARLREISQPLKILNLFAYTGGSTLAAAAAGAEVVHVDAARNTIAWARHNAELSALIERPIRWIAEDAMKFVKRELRRGNRYDAVVLDPPSYGHGPQGEVWRLAKHLPRLLEICGQLTAGRRRFMLLTCHTPGFDPARLNEMMADALGETDEGVVTARQLTIRSAAGRDLPSGVVARWQRHD